MKHKATELDIYHRPWAGGFFVCSSSTLTLARKGKESLSLARFLRRAADYIERKERKK